MKLIGRRLIGCVTVMATLISGPLDAAYNANLYGFVTSVIVYPGSPTVLFTLSTQPSSHPACNPSYFSLGSEIDEASRSRTVARLLAAKALEEQVWVGYDNLGSCADVYIRAYRVG